MNMPAVAFPGLIQPPPPREITIDNLIQSFHARRPYLSFYTHVPEWEEYERTQRPLPVIDHKCPMCRHQVDGSSLILSFVGQIPIPAKVLCGGCWKATSSL